MRIYGPNGAGPAAPPSSARRSSSSSFSLPNLSEAGDSRPTVAPTGVGNIDALLALQGVEDSVERRKRAVKRGRNALDVLDDLKIGLLSGSIDPGTVQRLRTAASELKTNSGDTSSGDLGLDSVLAEIELRVEVELAKAGSI
ncbi:flagellar assembly protein FliX [Bradyrhizobium sp. LHD-71]|uniref:flagellar assembly protein FliX n=1 Tax=Bradyrhizobium sp. LHD-71 TaxID=3072141 RepID=UPI00280C4ADC|nr:flagellar assembly protein FliX [Bradyrhizobium sp. LHD-71]MDQ8732603.1 flagellar assembly protein FliX [Bradyrhizobium sp. LHD-71]